MSSTEKARSARVYEAYAAAIESLDENVGRLVKHLKDKGELDNTFIVFFSDNGAEGNNIGIGPKQQDTDQFNAWLDENFDNSLDNIGRKNSYVSINEGWGQTSALPNRLYKGTTTEGGVRVPAFVYFPKAIQPGKTSAVVTVRDILPTFLDIAGTKHPGIAYQGRTVLPVQGTSALPLLTNADYAVHSANTPFGFELFGRSALRKGDWKIVRLHPPVGDGEWQLFNIANDPGELYDLVKLHGLDGDFEKLRHDQGWQHKGYRNLNLKLLELKRDWRAYVEQNNVIELGYDFGYGRLDPEN